MTRLAHEVLAFGVAAAFAIGVVAVPVSHDSDVSFFIAVIGALAVREAVRYVLKARFAAD